VQDWAVNYWRQSGAPTHKLIVGIGLYGRSFTLQNPAEHGFGAPALGAGRAGNYTNEPGFMAYYEVNLKFTHYQNWLEYKDSFIFCLRLPSPRTSFKNIMKMI